MTTTNTRTPNLLGAVKSVTRLVVLAHLKAQGDGLARQG
jgi:hypothetical protein